ncbi:tellurite resistance TerB family protein [Pseudooceanicola sp. 502str34]|uniref:tellurite resistance TerB family protein n=1 Tax=Maritimibacter alkaliphilus TaxID=404236 RepID=UPI001C9423CA|nr:tellurite resistance TerB family protein [Maritimibacter alkaliphilus]MBY6089266.1 tellurite resistance TerB family protein [Maritimibacter alkaliphilus]
MDVNRLLEGFLGSGGGQKRSASGTSGGLPDGLLGGATAGGLAALLLGSKKGRKLGGKALKIGGMAVVGGLAYKAYSDWQAKKTSGTEAEPLNLPKPPADSGFDVENDHDAGGEDFRLALMKAMIAAAKSDGHIDQEEHARIHEQIGNLGLGSAEKSALFDYFAAPADPVAVARLARTTEQRAEIYLASALSIDPDTPEEQQYLESLAGALQMPEGLRGHLDLEAQAARRQAEG